jgi:hypothetical protein
MRIVQTLKIIYVGKVRRWYLKIMQAVCGVPIVFEKANKDRIIGVSYERENGEF